MRWDFTLLHKHGVAWESELAKEINEQVFSFIHNEAHAETELLAEERGAYLDGEKGGKRNSHLLAGGNLNASSGVILGTNLFNRDFESKCIYTQNSCW